MNEEELAQIILDEIRRQSGDCIWGTDTLDVVAIDGDISPRDIARAVLDYFVREQR